MFQVNIIKNSLRNLVQRNMLNRVITIRAGLRSHGKCCNTFEIPKEVLDLIGTGITYEHFKKSENSTSSFSDEDVNSVFSVNWSQLSETDDLSCGAIL